MKKRFISKLLMATLVVVTMGVFSSCKDYDDDINANSAEIQNLKSQVKTLDEARKACEENIQKLQAAVQAAQTAADKAQTAADKAQAAADKAQAAADAADAKAVAAQGTADQAVAAAAAADAKAVAAQAAADAADAKAVAAQARAEEVLAEAKLAAAEAEKNAIAKAQEKVDALYTKIQQEFVTKEAFNQKVDELDAKKADITWVNEQLKGVNAVIDSLAKVMKDHEADALAKYNELKNKFDDYYTKLIVDKKFDEAYAYMDAEIAALTQKVKADSLYAAETYATIVALKDLEKTVDGNVQAIEALKGRVKDLEDANFIKSADLDDAESAIRKTMAAAAAAATDKLLQDLTAEDGLITKLQKQADKNTQDISDLQNAMKKADDALKYSIDSLAANTRDLLAGKADLDEFNLLKDVVNGRTENFNKLVAWMEAAKANTEKIPQMLKDIEKALKKADSLGVETTNIKNDINTKYDFLLDSIGVVANNLKQVKSEVEALTSRVTIIENGLKTLTSDLNQLFLFLDRDLTSIVTLPDEWIYGLPRIDAILVKLNKTFGFQTSTWQAAVNGAAGQAVDVAIRPAQGQEFELRARIEGTAATVKQIPADKIAEIERQIMGEDAAAAGKAFDINAKYWLNPNTVNADNYTFGFDEIPTKNTISRGDEDNLKANPTNINAKYQGDTLYVTFNLADPDNVNNAKLRGTIAMEDNETWAWITTLALTATRKDAATPKSTYSTGDPAVTLTSLDDEANKGRRIISDYAILTPSYIDTIAVANIAKYEGIVKDLDVLPHEPRGNQQFHTNNTFGETWNEDQLGTYSFKLNRTNKDEKIVLKDSIVFHYREMGQTKEKQWTVKQAEEEQGFKVTYKILTDADYFKITDDGTVTVKEDKREIASTAGKVAIVLVQLTGKDKDGKEHTYAYGYVSILITNDTTQVRVEMPELKLNCDTQDSIEWKTLIDAINKGLGAAAGTSPAENTTYFEWIYFADNDLQKHSWDGITAKASEDNKYGQIGKQTYDGKDYLHWDYTTEEVLAKFYKDGKALIEEGAGADSTWIKIKATPDGIAQGYQDIMVKIVITGVVYPKAKFSFGDRIQQYWFNKEQTTIAATAEERFEVHGSVEAVGQAGDNDDFNYDFSATFANQNNFVIYGPDGKTASIDFGDEIEKKNVEFLKDNGTEFREVYVGKAYFDAEKYHVLTDAEAAALTGTEKVKVTLKGDEATTSTFTTAEGKFLLFLTNVYPDPDDPKDNLKTLYAVKADANGDFYIENPETATHVVVPGVPADEEAGIPAIDPVTAPNVQAVVVLSGDHNEIASFQGKEDPTSDYARTMLNNADHLLMGANQTFVTHMLLDVDDYCLPIDWIDESNRFDIRYLRPISGEAGSVDTIVDAEDDGADVYLADILNFQDWRAVANKKAYHFTYQNMRYINYYGIKKININFNDIESNIHGTRKLLRIDTKKVSFEDHTGEWDGSSEDPADFRDAIGYFHYENNESVVSDFELYIPLTIEYHWGTTAKEWITLKVTRTVGNGARR